LCVLASLRTVSSELMSARLHMGYITPTTLCLWNLLKNCKLFKKFCPKSTRKIHYLDCSRYSSDSGVIHFNLLRPKDVPFQDDTYFPFC
jgi:hypothetical protein